MKVELLAWTFIHYTIFSEMPVTEALARLQQKCTSSSEAWLLAIAIITRISCDGLVMENTSSVSFDIKFYQARFQEHLLTPQGWPSGSTCILEAELGKLDIQRREPGILFIA